MDQRVFLAIPSYDGTVTHTFIDSFIASLAECGANDIGVRYKIWVGNCYVEQARNYLIREFLKSDCTDMLFIDADVAWDASKVPQILSYDKDIVAGIYPYKSNELNFPAIWKNPVRWDGDLLEMQGVPTGFLRIRRNVLEKFIEKFPERLTRQLNPDGSVKDEYYHIFRCFQRGEMWFGEDYNFCYEWAEMGGSLWAMPDVQFLHTGRKCFEGNYLAFLKEKGIA